MASCSDQGRQRAPPYMHMAGREKDGTDERTQGLLAQYGPQPPETPAFTLLTLLPELTLNLKGMYE